MHAVMVVFSDKVFTSVQKLHRLSFTSKMQHNCWVYFLEIVFPYGRGKASLDVYLKELSVHSRMSDLICHHRETHAHSLKKSLQICRLSSHILRGRCPISRRISSIWSIISSLQSGLDRDSFSAALWSRLCAERSLHHQTLLNIRAKRAIACLKAAASVFISLRAQSLFSHSWHSSKFRSEMKEENISSTFLTKYTILPHKRIPA